MRELTFDPTSPGTPIPVMIGSTHENFLAGVACPSNSQCTAIDFRGHEVTFDPTSPGAPPSITIDSNAGLSAVACPSSVNAPRLTILGIR